MSPIEDITTFYTRLKVRSDCTVDLYHYIIHKTFIISLTQVSLRRSGHKHIDFFKKMFIFKIISEQEDIRVYLLFN